MRIIFLSILIVWCSTVLHAQSDRSLVREGNRQYNGSKYADAEVNYRKALEKNKELKQGPFNLGDALYKQGRFGEAANQYNTAASRTSDAEVKAQAYHNLGNALLKERKLPESISAYKEALKLAPKDADTKYNLEYAKALLQQQQQQKQDKNQKKDDKQKQDQQKQDQQKQDEKKKDEQKQNEQQQNQKQNEDEKKQQQQGQPKKQQISKQDAERILEALKNEEKDVQKKLHKKVPARVRVEKDW
jgi:Ca-activated chloride channel family protein